MFAESIKQNIKKQINHMYNKTFDNITWINKSDQKARCKDGWKFFKKR